MESFDNKNKGNLRAWLISEGEPLPVDGNQRLMRAGMLADYLSAQGMEVVWWSSSFIHGKKQYYCKETKRIRQNENYTLYLLHSKISYRKNVSLKRILYHKMLAVQFRKESRKSERPDIIICAYPTVQFAEEAVRYGKEKGVPVVLDVRDLWPDIFTRAFPDSLKQLAEVGISWLQRKAKRVFADADYICGTVPYFVQWGLDKAGRKKKELDQTIHIGYDESTEIVEKKDYEKWKEYGISQETWNISFISTLSSTSLDLTACIEAVKMLSGKYPQLRLVICGSGDGLETYRQAAGGNPAIVFAGWCDNRQIKSLLNISNLGLYCLRNWKDFRDTLSNKMIAYMAAGLPVLSSLEGYSYQYITKYKIGLKYQEGSPEDCAEKIEFFLSRPDLSAEYGANSRARYEADFTSEKVNGEFKRMIQKICRKEEERFDERGTAEKN